jgi:LPXTG-motif cell wall-anchored protein
MRKLLSLFVLILSIGVLSGCVKGVFHVKVNKDGSADINYDMGFENTLLGLASSDGKNPIEEIRKQAEEQGFTVANYKENGYTGIRAKKHVDKLNDIPIFSNMEKSKDKKPLKIEKGLFSTRYTLDTQLDLSDMATNSNEEMANFNNAVLNQMDLKFLLDLPVKAEKHNASNVKNDGQTLEWQLIPGDKNRVYMEAVVPNIMNITLTIIGVLIILVGALFMILKKRKRNRIVTN